MTLKPGELGEFLRVEVKRGAWDGSIAVWLEDLPEGVTAEEALWRPAPGRHSIWELAVHCAYWKYAVRRKLTGVKRGAFPRKGSNWLPPGDSWEADLRLLRDEHRALRNAVARASAQQLAKYERLIYAVAAHDTYHTGQIQLIKRLHGK